jgi:hypothetical protein
MGYTAQDVEDIAAGLLSDLPQTLMVGPVALDDDRRAREATQLAKLESWLHLSLLALMSVVEHGWL